MKKIILVLIMIISIVGIKELSFAAVNYQDFENDNGTPVGANEKKIEYGWGFEEAKIRRTKEGEPVHSGEFAWRVELPENRTLKGGSGIPSQVQTYQIDFFGECHDRLTFWVWPDSIDKSQDHNVLVKFFDRKNYTKGVGLWTKDAAKDQRWLQLHIRLDTLPKDFDMTQVDHIEFMHYWGGVYYYDDIQLESSFSHDREMKCYQKHYKAVCPSSGMKGECATVYDPSKAELIFDYLYLKEK